MPSMPLKLASLIVMCCAGLAFAPVPARADGKFLDWDWEPSHWEDWNPAQPYIENPTQTQNQQWNDDPWSPSVWAKQRKGGGQEVINGFYTADIIRDQYTKHGTAAVEVGPRFYMLGGNDQRKVAAMIDDVYGVTKNKVYGMFTLYDWNTHEPIGTYTQYGLVMK